MIDREELLNNKDFYRSFKTGEDLTSFFKQMHKQAVEHMLEAELDGHQIKKIKSYPFTINLLLSKA